MRKLTQPFLRIALIGFAIAALSACAFGRKVDYAAPVDLDLAVGSLRVALAVLDHRSYVLSGDKGPSFVGLQRDGYGIPFNVNTQSGRPLAEDLSGALAQSLSAKGYAVEQLTLAHSTPTNSAVAQAAGTGAERFVILKIGEWKTDQLQQAALYYSLSLAVYDPQSSQLARNEISGRDNLGGDYLEGADEIAPAAFRRKMAQLFGSPEVKAALAGATP